MTGPSDSDGLSEALAEQTEALQLDLDGFEGPLHVLLELARTQKVDLARLSMAALADQFIAFMDDVQGRRIDVAAEFLLMAAWLAWLKSRLLLPKPERPVEEPDPEAESARLKARLLNLEAARRAARQLDGLAHLGRDCFLFGAPQAIAVDVVPAYEATLSDLLRAYGRQRSSAAWRRHQLPQRSAYPIAKARDRLSAQAQSLQNWTPLEDLAESPEDSQTVRESVVASTLGAALELVRDQVLSARQDAAFSPVLVRARAPDEPPP